jgi:hypothetical protein
MAHRIHAWHPPRQEVVGAFAYRPPRKSWYRNRWVFAAALVVILFWVVAL